jgi:hypothetical protein
MNKATMNEKGLTLIRHFCQLNDLPAPRVTLALDDWAFSACAYYRPTRGIVIHLPSCAHIGTSGQQWSYPGWAVDRTPYGVLAHELGHHVDWLLGEPKDRGDYWSYLSRKLRAALRTTAKLTSYCPNDAEWFAELFRLYVTNPDLLSKLRPRFHEALSLVLAPAETRPWDAVLAHAPQRSREQAAARVAKGR